MVNAIDFDINRKTRETIPLVFSNSLVTSEWGELSQQDLTHITFFITKLLFIRYNFPCNLLRNYC